MQRIEKEGEFKKQIRERLHWRIGRIHTFPRDTRIVTEDDFDILYRILDDAKKEIYEAWASQDIHKLGIVLRKWFGSIVESTETSV